MAQERCSKCGQYHSVEPVQSINTALDPQLKKRVKDGSLFVWECPYCGTRNLLTGQTLYHDPEAKLMLWMLPEGQEPPQAVAEAVKQLEGYTLRIVRETGDLIEKVNIADAHLDDVVMEVCKWVTRQELAIKNPSAADVRLRFLRTEGADSDLVLAFPLEGHMNLVNVGFNVYEDAAGIVSRNPQMQPPCGFSVIDAAWCNARLR